MSNFAKSGYEVCFINNTGFAKPKLSDLSRIYKRFFPKNKFSFPVPTNISVYSPVIIPSTAPLSSSLNNKYFFPKVIETLCKMGFGDPDLLYTYLPTPFTISLIDNLKPARVVYDYVGDFFAHPRKPANLQEMHSKLIALSNIVLTDSTKLKAFLDKDHKNVHILHHGVSPAFFNIKLNSRPKEIRKLLYFGTIDASILDFHLIRLLAEQGYQVSMAGLIKGHTHPKGRNISYKGMLNEQELVAEIENCDAIIFPYKETELNKSVIPAKLYQSLASGKPIVSFGLPLMEEFRKFLYIANSHLDFIDQFNSVMTLEAFEKINERRYFAKKNLESVAFNKLHELIYSGEN